MQVQGPLGGLDALARPLLNTSTRATSSRSAPTVSRRSRPGLPRGQTGHAAVRAGARQRVRRQPRPLSYRAAALAGKPPAARRPGPDVVARGVAAGVRPARPVAVAPAPRCSCSTGCWPSAPSCTTSSSGRPTGLPPVNWNSPAETRRTSRCPKRSAPLRPRSRSTTHSHELRHRLARCSSWPDAEPVVGRLLDAVQRRETPAMPPPHARLARLHHVRNEVRERDEGGRRLAAAHRGWPGRARRPPDPVWPGRLAASNRRGPGRMPGAGWTPPSTVDVDRLQREIIPPRTRSAARVAGGRGHPRLEPRRRTAVPRLAGRPGAVRPAEQPVRQGHRSVPGAAARRAARRHGAMPSIGAGVDHAGVPDRRPAADRAGHV